jgi:hypothetical protein
MAATDKNATIEELLEAVFSVRSEPRLYNEGQVPLEQGLEMEVRRAGGWCEIAVSLRVSGMESSWESIVPGQSPTGNNVSTEEEDIVGIRHQATNGEATVSGFHKGRGIFWLVQRINVSKNNILHGVSCDRKGS